MYGDETVCTREMASRRGFSIKQWDGHSAAERSERREGKKKKASRNRRSSTSVCAQLAAQHTDGEGRVEGDEDSRLANVFWGVADRKKRGI